MSTHEYGRGVVQKGRYDPVHLTAAKAMVDGVERIGFFATDDVAKDQLAERKVKPGDRYKAKLQKERNVMFFRLAHKLGQWLAANHEAFEDFDGHEALKELQRRSGVGCETTRSDIRDNEGTLIYRVVSRQPLSLAFDCMKEHEFRILWDGGEEKRHQGGWMGWMRKHLYPDMADTGVAQIERMIVGREVEWKDEIEKQQSADIV